MRRFLSIMLALGLVLSLSLVTAVPVLAVPEVWVDDNFDASTPGWGTTHFDNIQAGIAAADSPGGIVNVAAGAYNEDITLTNGVDVLGAGADVITITGTGTGSVVSASNVFSPTTFDGFTVTGGDAGYGGGMYIDASTLTVSNCVFQGNHTDNDGGGMFINDASPTVNSCTFDTNTADTRGGGIACVGTSSPLIANNIIIDNTVTAPSSFAGGGIYANPSADPTIINNNIIDNMVNGFGGGIYFTNSSTTITNNIIIGNVATMGGGIYATSSPPNPAYNDVFANTPNDYSGCSGGTGSISVDPDFETDYNLSAISPCIDVGDNAAVTAAGLTTDYEGEPRVFDGDDNGTDTVDIGADEYYVAPPPPPPGGPVGGTVYPIDKTAILLPWLGLIAALILAASGLILVRRLNLDRPRQQG
jgi:serine protease